MKIVFFQSINGLWYHGDWRNWDKFGNPITPGKIAFDMSANRGLWQRMINRNACIRKFTQKK